MLVGPSEYDDPTSDQSKSKVLNKLSIKKVRHDIPNKLRNNNNNTIATQTPHKKAQTTIASTLNSALKEDTTSNGQMV